jgi:hypothetical protein
MEPRRGRTIGIEAAEYPNLRHGKEISTFKAALSEARPSYGRMKGQSRQPAGI